MILESLKLRKHFEEFRTLDVKRYSGRYLLILSLDKESLKLGIRISKRIGNAVRRNRIRRIIRENVRQNIDSLNQCCHYLIIPKESVKTLSENALSRAIRDDLARGLKF